MYTSLQYGCQVMGACLQGVERKLCSTLVCIQKGFALVWCCALFRCNLCGCIGQEKSQHSGWLWTSDKQACLLGVYRFLLASLAEFAPSQHQDSAAGGSGHVEPRVGGAEVAQHGIAGHGFATDPADQGRAQGDDDGEALHEFDHQSAAENHHRNADGQANDQ